MKAQRSQAKQNGWKFLYSPIPKQIYRRMKTAKLSTSAIFVYLHIIDSLNGKTKTGWTIARTDQQVAESVGISSWGARTCRRELVKLGFVDQKQYTMNGKRVIGTWTFKIKQTEPACKKVFDKYAKKAAGEVREVCPPTRRVSVPGTEHVPAAKTSGPSEEKVLESATEMCGESPQESVEKSQHKHVADCYTNSDPEPVQKPVIEEVSADENAGGKDIVKDINKVPPISPLNLDALKLAWNESHEYEEGEGEEFDKYFDKALRATTDQYNVDVDVAQAALIRAFHKTKRNAAGHHPFNFPTAYTGDPDHAESNAIPRGKKILQGAIHAVKSAGTCSEPRSETSPAGDCFSPKPTSSTVNPPNEPTTTEKPTPETYKPQDSELGSACAAAPKQAEVSRSEPLEAAPAPPTPLETIRRNLAGRASMLKAGIISPLSRDDVLSHAQSGLEAFDDVPGEDVILGVWDELVPTVDAETDAEVGTPPTQSEPVSVPPEPSEIVPQPDAPFGREEEPRAFSELTEIQAKIVDLDQMRRGGMLSVDEVAEVAQEIAVLKRKRIALQCRRAVNVDGAKRAAFSLEDVMGMAMAGASGVGGTP